MIKIRVKLNSHIPSTLRFCYWRKIRNICPAIEHTEGKVSPSHLVNIFVQQNNNVTQPCSFPYQHLRVISQPFFSVLFWILEIWLQGTTVVGFRTESCWWRLKRPEGKVQSVFFRCLGKNPRSQSTVIIISTSARCASYFIILNWLFIILF